MATARKIEVPGEVAAEQPEASAEEAAPAQPAIVEAPNEKALKKQIAELQAQINQQQKDAANLPAAKDVDPTKIIDRVLTRDGWILPTKAQAHANG